MPPRLLHIGLLALCLPVARASGGEPVQEEIPQDIQRLSDSQVTQRLTFLSERLDAHRDYAWWWWHGWTAFYGLGVVVEGVRAGVTDNDARQAEYVVGSVKAAGGFVVLLLRRPGAMRGADALRALPDATLDDRRRQLAVAEEQLQGNAKQSRRRYSWLSHAINLGVNAAGGVIIATGWDDPSRGARSAGVGAAIGELSIWTHPWWPANDWEEYQRRFNSPAGPRVSWSLVPTVRGAAFRMNF